MKYINKIRRMARQLFNCIRPYNGFRNRKIIKGFSGFERKLYNTYWNKAANTIGATITDIGYGYLRISKNNKKTYVRNFHVMLDDHVTLNVAGNKPLVLKILKENGFQVPQHLEYKIENIDEAQKFLLNLGKNAVVKPASGTGSGRGVTTNIDNEKKLLKSSNYAALYCDTLLIEEQVEGDSFRLLYLNGEFVDAIRRDPPVVTGDGNSTLKQLIKNENNKRLSSKEVMTFHPLIIDMECKLKLREQNLTINSILEDKREIVVKKVVNQNSCNQNHIVRDEVHPSIIATGQQVVNELGIILGGIDVITQDITLSLDETGGVINEINTTPGLHHHVLVSEKNKILPIGEMVLSYILDK